MTRQLAGDELAQRIKERIGDVVKGWSADSAWIQPPRIIDVCLFLRDDPSLQFNYLNSITAVDYIDHFEIIYHLTSLEHNHAAILKARVYGRESPSLPSVIQVWPGANFQEREIWDLMGVAFEEHPNLKRILLWEGFPGHPLRKDYTHS